MTFIAACVPRKRGPRAIKAHRTCILLILIVLSAGPCLVHADDGHPATAQVDPGRSWTIQQWRIFTSVYTRHFNPDPDQVNTQKLIGIEAGMENHFVLGLAMFDNSFGQDTQYLFAGYRWDLFGSDLWHFKLTGGLLHGYKEPYKRKIPLNHWGVAPAIVPTLGFQYRSFTTELNLAGAAAVTITAGVALSHHR